MEAIMIQIDVKFILANEDPPCISDESTHEEGLNHEGGISHENGFWKIQQRRNVSYVIQMVKWLKM